MGCYHVFFPVKNEEHDFGYLILEWECLTNQMWNWVGTWVDTEEELKNYKYKREGIETIVNMPKLIKVYAEHMAQVHHREMMRRKELEKDDWKDWVELQKSTPKPYLNLMTWNLIKTQTWQKNQKKKMVMATIMNL